MSYETSYAGLKADLMQNADDYSSDFMANMDTIIAESETKALRDLDLEFMQDEADAGTLAIGVRTLSRPTSLLKINAIYLVVGGVRKFIEKRTKSYCETYGEDQTQGRPVYWAEQSEDYLYFVGTPDAEYQCIGYGLVRPDGLSESNPTTWLSLHAGDLLLNICKQRSDLYLLNPDMAGQWGGLYQNDLLPKAKIELRGLSRASYDAAKAASTASQIV